MTRILYVGESWLGSCARSLKEAILRCPKVTLEEINEDLVIPKSTSLLLKAANRLLYRSHRTELLSHIMRKIQSFKPDFVMTYKGWHITRPMLEQIKSTGVVTVNVYPDCSPHAHGLAHQEAVGTYDLVVSTKPYHPPNWKSTYGYDNQCTHVPQGYDPLLHVPRETGQSVRFDLALVATWRQEYQDVLTSLATRLRRPALTFGIGGNGWRDRKAQLPSNTTYSGPLCGQSYVTWLRSAKICLAPLTTIMKVENVSQPGDLDTTRTYELAAAGCFFIHRRTPYVQTVYDETNEVPMYDSTDELAEHVNFFLENRRKRERMALAANRRAVPDYSLDARAQQILSIINARF